MSFFFLSSFSPPLKAAQKPQRNLSLPLRNTFHLQNIKMSGTKSGTVHECYLAEERALALLVHLCLYRLPLANVPS
jgi:hypothetical protein